MRRDCAAGPAPRALARPTLLVLGLLAVSGGPARAQVPQPFYPTAEQRSGLISRFLPPEQWLPYDRYRDPYYITRFSPRADSHPNHPNTILQIPRIKDSGLYGRRWPVYHTQSFYPYFFGSPGDTTTPASKPWPNVLKLPQTFLAPLRPYGYYYEQGSYVPLFDLDPIVPGPGPCPYWFPWYWNPRGGSSLCPVPLNPLRW